MPKTTLTITTRPLDWSPRKLADVEGEIIRYFAQMGAPGTTVSYQTEGEEPAKPPEELFLHLCCTECNVEWYAKAFNPCGGCGKRETVAKMESGRVPLPSIPTMPGIEARGRLVPAETGPDEIPGMIVELLDPEAVLTVKTEELPFLVGRADAIAREAGTRTVEQGGAVATQADGPLTAVFVGDPIPRFEPASVMAQVTSEQLDAAEMASHERLGEMPTGEISTRPPGSVPVTDDEAVEALADATRPARPGEDVRQVTAEDLEVAGQALEGRNGETS